MGEHSYQCRYGNTLYTEFNPNGQVKNNNTGQDFVCRHLVDKVLIEWVQKKTKLNQDEKETKLNQDVKKTKPKQDVKETLYRQLSSEDGLKELFVNEMRYDHAKWDEYEDDIMAPRGQTLLCQTTCLAAR